MDFALALEPLQELPAHLGVHVDLAHVHGHEALAGGEAEQLQQRRVRVEHLPRERGAVEADGHALEERAIARLGLPRDPPPRRLFEGGADGRHEPWKVMRVLQDVVVEARLHRRDGELLAAGAGAEKDRQVQAPLTNVTEKVKRVDPARPMIGDDDVEGSRLEQGGEALGILELDDPTAGEAALQSVRDHGAVSRILVDDEDSQRFACSPGSPCRGSAGRGIGKHWLSVSGSALCLKTAANALKDRAGFSGLIVTAILCARLAVAAPTLSERTVCAKFPRAVPCDVVRPVTSACAPLVILVHGRSGMSFYAERLAGLARRLAASGFVVIAVAR